MANSSCFDPSNDPATAPCHAPLTRFMEKLFRVSEEDQLIAKWLVDSSGEFRMRHPIVTTVLMEMLKPKLVAALKELEAEVEAKTKKCGV